MCRADEKTARVGSRFRVNMFWMGHSPFVMNRNYKIKLAAARVQVNLVDVLNVLDASELSTVSTKRQVDRHDVAECILETLRPIGFDLRNDVEATGRFVIVDKDEIAGCGIILEQIQDGESILRDRIRQREFTWERGLVTSTNRESRFNHRGKCIIVTGSSSIRNRDLAKTLEYDLFRKQCNTYYLGIGNVFEDLDVDERTRSVARDEHVRRLGELARIMTDAGLLFITTLTGVDDHDLSVLKLLNEPNELFVINIGECGFTRFPVDMSVSMDANDKDVINRVVKELNTQDVLLDYYI
jgi:bifunctional enzyme CysN/CysC